MVAGGRKYPIWFTNLIYHSTLYTLTYKWPNIPLNSLDCSKIPGIFNRRILNKRLDTSRYVGREILQRRPRRFVNHWRVGIVLPQLPPGQNFRIPIALGDIYVDQRDRNTFWRVLHFGFQNLFDPELDEWMAMRTFVPRRAGKVRLPKRCPPPTS
jgi:hypothetical protein